MFSSSANIIFSIYLENFSLLALLDFIEKCKNKIMGNCLSKSDNELFTLHAPRGTSGHHKKISLKAM